MSPNRLQNLSLIRRFPQKLPKECDEKWEKVSNSRIPLDTRHFASFTSALQIEFRHRANDRIRVSVSYYPRRANAPHLNDSRLAANASRCFRFGKTRRSRENSTRVSGVQLAVTGPAKSPHVSLRARCRRTKDCCPSS